MLFNSLAFVIFLPIVFISYWFFASKKLKWQNYLLIVASYFFYGWWDWRFLALIFFSSISDYLISLQIDKSDDEKIRKRWLYLSIFLNLGTLFTFKYYNFFIENFVHLFSHLGITFDNLTLNIVLPVGISFYTFQSMSYTIDVYRKDMRACKNLSVFLAYISFFPQLVAGPIERASHLIPQFLRKRKFSYEKAVDGMRQILWGFFKKVVIADNASMFVTKVFDNYDDFSGSTLVLGIILFAFQLYADFSGYSDIAIGTAKLFGFDLMDNFNFPYFSKNVTEFWRKWHISLSSWLRDYLYTPLAIKLRNYGMYGIVFTTIISFVLIGLWHGANWTFVVFGLLQGGIISYELLSKKIRKKIKKKFNINLYNIISRFYTFTFFCASLIFFRSESISDALEYYKGIFSISLLSFPTIFSPKFRMVYVILFILFFITIEWFRKDKKHVLQIEDLSLVKRWGIYSGMILVIIFFGRFSNNDFIYFQF